MFVLGHLGIGSRLLFSLRTRLPAGWLYLGCLLPDLIDKPLFYVPLLVMHRQLPLITGTRTFGHTGLFLLAWLILALALRRPWIWAVFAGLVTHFALDIAGETPTRSHRSGSPSFSPPSGAFPKRTSTRSSST